MVDVLPIPVLKAQMPLLVPLLRYRLTTSSMEPAEELCVELLRMGTIMVKRLQKSVAPFYDDLMLSFSAVLTDKCPEVLIEVK